MPAPTSTPATTMSASTAGRTASGGAPRPTYHEPTFRTWPPESVTRRDGTMVTIIVCEDLVDGRWEPFCSIREHRPPRQASGERPLAAAERQRGGVMMASRAIPEGLPGRTE